VKHPDNTFILVYDASRKVPKLYEGKKIRELAACGLTPEPWGPAPCAVGYDACCLLLDAL
tara:strand:- start:194 stop:373 length:180 start_codon:yes stop_codon:yes gene_type:complete